MSQADTTGAVGVAGAKKKRLTFGFLSTYATYGGVLNNVLAGLQDAAKTYDVNLILYFDFTGSLLSSKKATLDWLTSCQFINTDNLDGLITWASALCQFLGVTDIEGFHKRFKPLPMISLGMPLNGVPAILANDRQGIQSVMRHLVLGHGFTRIAYTQGYSYHYAYKERYQAYLDALAEHNLPFRPELVAPAIDEAGLDDQHHIRTLFGERKLRAGKDIEAIITPSDQFAIAAVRELKTFGLDVPRDLVITGFNNSYKSQPLMPPFTTVDPNFYNHGYYAVEGLLAIIQGAQLYEKIYMPTELLIRQSCGCFESPILQAKPDQKRIIQIKKLNKTRPIVALISEYKPDILIELYELFKNSGTKVPIKVIIGLLDAFIADITAETATSNNFLYKLNEYFNKQKEPELKLTIWQNAFSVLRSLFLPLLKESKIRSRAEDLLHQARVSLFIRNEYAPDMIASDFNLQSYRLTEIGGQFISTLLDVTKIVDVLEKELLQLSIPGCYLCLYEKDSAEKKTARLILAINEQGKMDLEGKDTFCPHTKLLPDGFLAKDKRRSLIVKVCYYGENQLGYLVFDIEHLDIILYEFLRVNFSSMLQVASTIQERVKIENEREKLVTALELKNQELEETAVYMKVINEQLEKAIGAANRANSAKSIFLANMSHEIRTPMNSVMGFIEILSKTNLDNAQHEYIKVLKKSTQSLLGVINDILDISKIESGNIEIDIIEFNPLREFELVSELFTVKANERKIELLSFISPDLPAGLKGDALRVKQVLMNLLSNAVKFTEPGGTVTLLIDVIRKTAGECKIRFSVVDTGIGIKPEFMEKIFKPFEQLDSSISRKYGGTGLGLAICSNLVTLMGGKLGLTSEEGKGSTFYFELLFPIVNSNPENRQSQFEELSCCIGFYQPPTCSPAQADFIMKYLRSIQQTAKTFSNKEQLASLGKLDILFYVYSPIYEEAITGIIKETEDLPHVIIASLLDSPRLTKNSRYFKNIIYQPTSPSKIFDAICRILYGKKSLMQPSDAEVKFDNAKVLVAEDNETNQQLISILLNDMGITVDLANDGFEAFKLFKENKYDLILMDGNMPRCDGMEAAKQFIAFEKTVNLPHTPIVALTAKAIRGDRESFLWVGMDDYISKPIQFDELKRILVQYLKNNDKRAPCTDIPRGTTRHQVAFSKEAAAGELNLSLDKYSMLLKAFLDKAVGSLTGLGECIEQQDFSALYQQSHKLKGAALNLRLKQLGGVLQALEDASRQGEQADYTGLLAQAAEEVRVLRNGG